MNGVGCLFLVSRVEVLFSSDIRGGSGLASASTSSPTIQALPTMYLPRVDVFFGIFLGGTVFFTAQGNAKGNAKGNADSVSSWIQTDCY